MGLFGMGGGKKDTEVLEGEMGPGMVNMLAGMPGMMRKQMMKGRLSQLLTLSEEKRQETILGMFTGFHHPSVKDKNREKVIATRTDIIGELPDDKRRALISSRIAALKQSPEIDAADHKVVEKVLPQVPGKARQAFTDTFGSLSKGSES